MTDLKQLSLGHCGHALRSLRPLLTQFPFQVPLEEPFHGVGNREVITALIPLTALKTTVFIIKKFDRLKYNYLVIIVRRKQSGIMWCLYEVIDTLYTIV